MPFVMQQFMTLVKQCNPSFKRFTRQSDLDPLIDALGGESGQTFYTPTHRARINDVVHVLASDKANKYRVALLYLAQELGVDPGPIPCRPKMSLREFGTHMGEYEGINSVGATKRIELNPRSFNHAFKFTWESTNGDLQALRNVGTRENVKWRSDPGGTPFNYVQGKTPMQFTQGATTNNGANSGYCVDDHSTILPALICLDPRVTGSIVAEQLYEYTCDGRTWKPIPGAAYLLEKGVRTGGPTGHLYYFMKTNWAPHNTTPYHFEVEYTVDPAPAYMPKPGTPVAKGLTTKADISDYAHRVIGA